MKETFTISELEKASGLPRSTIHFYIHQRLLPAGQRTGGRRPLYATEHLAILKKIARLKAKGLTLDEIRNRLQTDIREANAATEDLVSRVDHEVHQAILRAATDLFVSNGYGRTHLTDIVATVGISRQVFYEHFPSKAHLLLECFRQWNVDRVESDLPAEPDSARRTLGRMIAYLDVQRLSSELLSLVSSGAVAEEEFHSAVEKTYRSINQAIVDELRSSSPLGRGLEGVDEELIAYSLFGALDMVVARGAWDDKYSLADLMYAHLHVFLAVEALYTGRFNIAERCRQHRDTINEMAAAARPPSASDRVE